MKALPLLLSLAFLPVARSAEPPADPFNVDRYPSIQEAIDKNPGKVLYIPAGDHAISKALTISANDTGLCGPGRIIQSNPAEAILKIAHASGVQVRDVTLLRPEGRTDTEEQGIAASQSAGLVLDNVTVRDNRTRSAAIILSKCDGVSVRHCLVRDYMRICEEDRRQKKGQGYAFMTLGGTGIDIRTCTNVLVQGTRVIEAAYSPTRELRDKYGLGKFTRKNPVKGEYVSQAFWDSNNDNAWNQGAAIHVGGSDFVRLLGNYIENAAQGIDIQSDHVIMADNIVNMAFAGMKAIHGSRNLIMTGNQFSKNDLWATSIGPGTASHAAGTIGPDGKPMEANTDGGSIVADNIISDFGYGPANWMWSYARRYAMRFDEPQLEGTPPIKNVVVEGNIVYDTGRDQILSDGKPQIEPPGYTWAIYVSTLPGAPENIRISNNIFDPGKAGVSNIKLQP